MSFPILRLPKRVYSRAPKCLPLMEQYPLYALSLGGVDGYINAGSNPSLDDLSELTYAIWIYPTQTTDEILFDKLSTKYLWLPTNRTIRGAIETGANFTTIDTVTNNAWNCILMTFSFSGDKKIHIYLKDVECGYSLQTAATLMAADAGGDLGIGARLPAVAYPFKGLTALPSIYNRVLTEAERKHNIYNPLNPIRSGLVLFLPMIEGQGINVADYSGQGNNGTLNGGISWKDLMKYEIPAGANL